MANRFGKYDLIVRLAAGGMAEIFLARQHGIMGFERFVVIKKILPHLAQDKQFVLMFFDEARIAARLNHPNVIQVHELGEQEGEYYIAMEYLEGQSLATLLREANRQKKPPSPAVTASVGIQVCEGLHYAHEALDSNGRSINLVHRDVTPQNIFITYSGIVKLVDFGIAQVEQKLVKTRTGTAKGKFAYMSPEQVGALPLDRRSDIFSLGVVLWETLVARRLFKHDNELAIVQSIVRDPAPPPSSLRPEVPKELDAVVLKALRKDREKRYQNAAELQKELIVAAAESGLPTGPPILAETMRSLFSDTINQQKEMLQAAEQSLIEPKTPGALKPETDESLAFATVTRRKRRRLLGLVSALAGIAILAVLLVSAIATRDRRSLPAPDESGPQPEPVDAGGVVNTGTPDDDDREAPPDTKATKVLSPRTNWGIVNLRTEPSGATLTLNGRSWNQSPLQGMKLKAGLYRIGATKPGFAEARQEVRVTPGKTVDVVITLAAKPQPPPPAETGFLRLDTDPWTTVYLGEKKLGPTPLARIRLPAGQHRLRLVNPEEGIDQSIEVIIKPGELTTRTVRF